MVKLNRKIKGSTLIEVIVAMVITMTIMGIAFRVLENLNRTSNTRLKVNAMLKAEQVIETAVEEHELIDQTYDEQYMLIYKTVERYHNQEGICVIRVEVFDRDQKKICEKKQIVEAQ